MDEITKLFEERGLFVKQSAPLDKDGNLRVKYVVSSIDFLTDEVLDKAIFNAQSEIKDFLKVRKVTLKTNSVVGQGKVFVEASNVNQTELLAHLKKYCNDANPHLQGVVIPITSCKDLGKLFEDTKSEIKNQFLNALEKGVQKHLINKNTTFTETYDPKSDSLKFSFEV
jgi:hypothetical protein